VTDLYAPRNPLGRLLRRQNLRLLQNCLHGGVLNRAVFFDRLIGQNRFLSHKKGTKCPSLITDVEEARCAKLIKCRLFDAIIALLRAYALGIEDYWTAQNNQPSGPPGDRAIPRWEGFDTCF
jgi:hypothetical protein